MADYNGGTVRWVIDANTESFDSKMQGVQQTAEATSHSLTSFGRSFTNIFTGTLTAGATAATAALTGLVKKGIQATDFLETARVAMSGLTGSMAEGNKAMSIAAKYWQANPFQRIDVTNATKQLVQFGRNTNQISSDLETLGNVSLSTGMNIADLARYYARVSASGRAMTMDLEIMSDRGVPIYRELAKQLNTTTAGVREMASKGKIDFETFRKAMEGAVNPEAMEEYNNTLARQTDRLKGSIQILAGQLAGYKIINDELVISENGLEKAWTRLLKTLATELRSDKMKDAMEKIGNALARIVDKITEVVPLIMEKLSSAISFITDHGSTLLPIMAGVLTFLGRLGSRIPFVGGLINSFSQNVRGLGTSLLNLVKAKPGLTMLVAVFGYGFTQALKNSEEFRKTVSSLFKSLSEIASLVVKSIQPIFEALMSAFQELATSDVVQTILQGIAYALLAIANALKSIPSPVLTTLITALLTMKMMSVSPFMGIVTAITLVVGAIQKLAKESDFFTDLPQKFAVAAHNMITGLVNGLVEGAKKVLNFVRTLATNIITTFKRILGIHSPSRVMYEAGQFVGLGLAEGITDSSSAVQKAMDKLATDILSVSDKIIQNQVDFNVIDANGMYKAWKQVSKLFTVGSSQYASALEKMEDARKSVNLQILKLQEQYNEALDSSIDRISSMYGLFDEVELKSGKNANKLIHNLDQQVAKMQEWASAQEIISGLGIDQGLINELQAMGVDATSELSAIASMTSDELDMFNNLWLKKQDIANKAGVKQMEGLKNETLAQIDALKDGIDGETIDVQDVGGRLVANISEGIYGALPTLDSAFSKLDDYIAEAAKSLKSVKDTTESLAGSGDDGYNLPEVGGTIASQFEDLSDTVKNAGANFLSILPGVIGGIVAFKFGPKLLKWAGSKLFGGATSGVLGNLLNANVDKLAQSITESAKPAGKIAQSATQVEKSMQTTSKSFTKVNSFLDSIKKGAQTIIWIAGAIAAVAGALWLAYNALKDIDFLKFQVVLLEMVEAVAVFGALAKVADMLKIGAKGILVIAGIAADVALVGIACRVAFESMKDIDFVKYQLVIVEMIEALTVFGGFSALLGLFSPIVGPGLLMIAGVAADVALIGLACRDAYNNMKDIDFDRYQVVIVEMIEALTVMGGFSAIFGLLLPLVGAGWASIMAICDELVKVSNALYHVYTTVPDDFDKVIDKIDLIKKVLNKIIDTDLGSLIGSIVTSWEVGPLTRTMDMYARVAEQLARMSELNINAEKVNENLAHVQTALEKVKSKTDVISGWLQAWADEANASSVESAGRIIIIYGEVVDALNKLGNLKVNNSTYTAINSITTIINYIKDSVNGSWSLFSNVGGFERELSDIQSIVNKFTEIIPVVRQLSADEYKINRTTAINRISDVEAIVYQIGECGTGGWISNKEADLGLIQSILNKFTEIVPVANQIAQQKLAKQTALIKIMDVEAIIKRIGEVDTVGWITTKENDLRLIQSMLNKMTEIIPTANQLAGMNLNGEEAKKKVDDVKTVISKIASISVSWANQAATKEWVVGMAVSIVKKFCEFADATRQIGDVNSDAINSTIAAIENLFSNIANQINDKVTVFENLGLDMVRKLANGMRMGSAEVQTAGFDIQYQFWSAIESKMGDEYQQGAWMATQFANGLKSVSFDGIGQAMQSSLWWGIQNRMQDEYYQGQTMGYRFRQGLYDVDYGNAGWWAVKGFENGAWSLYGSVYNTGWWVANRFLEGLRDRGRQGSPWKTTMESGTWAVQGLIEGMQESERALVTEANTLADQVIEALTMDDISIAPELDTSLRDIPTMDLGVSGTYRNGSGVIINQENNNYTEYDLDRVNRDLAWKVSKV